MKAGEGATIELAGERLFATTAGALYDAARETLIVSDLHLEKGSAIAAHGPLLPPYDTRTTLRRIAALAKAFAPKAIISLGDAFHDSGADARMDEDDACLLDWLIARTRWVWVLGNHDSEPPQRFGGECAPEWRLGPIDLRHEPSEGRAEGEICGHLHPVARVRADGLLMRRRCYASDGARLVMPAFGAYAGGLNVLDPAFGPLFGDLTVHVLGGRSVYPFARKTLAPDLAAPRRARRPASG
jgi:hypothetical protein